MDRELNEAERVSLKVPCVTTEILPSPGQVDSNVLPSGVHKALLVKAYTPQRTTFDYPGASIQLLIRFLWSYLCRLVSARNAPFPYSGKTSIQAFI